MASSSGNLPYPFQFDPSQWSNPYTQFGKQALPFMGQMAQNTPTDAHGNPIQSYLDANNSAQALYQQQLAAYNAQKAQAPQGTTLNSAPAAVGAGLEAQGSQARAMQDAGYGDWAMLDPMMAQSPRPGATAGAGSVGATTGWNPVNSASAYPATPGSSAAPAAPTPPTPPNMSQAYLAALQNPGHVSTPGATVPQAATPSNQSGVLQQFLSNWQQGGGNTQGAGNYNNAGFFNALKGQV